MPDSTCAAGCLSRNRLSDLLSLFSCISCLLNKYAGYFVADLCFCAVISSRACSSAWLERIPDKDEAGGSSPPRPTSANRVRGISSAGRAPALQAGGQRFDPAILHQAWTFSTWGNEQVILKGWPVYYSIIGY